VQKEEIADKIVEKNLPSDFLRIGGTLEQLDV